MCRIEIDLTWRDAELWTYDEAARRPIRVTRSQDGADVPAAVYRLEFLNHSGELVGGPNTYVGESGDVVARLRAHRYGRGYHGRTMRRAIVEHLRSGGSVRVSALSVGTNVSINGTTIGANPPSGHVRRLLEQAALVAAEASGAELINTLPG